MLAVLGAAALACGPYEVGQGGVIRGYEPDTQAQAPGPDAGPGPGADDAGTPPPPPPPAGDGGAPPPPPPPPPGPDAGVVSTPFRGASVGLRCTNDQQVPQLVLSADDKGCADALGVFGGSPGAVLTLPTESAGSYTVDAIVCLPSGPCAPRRVSVRVDRWTSGQGAEGAWSFQLDDGSRAEGSFTAPWCDFDALTGGGGGGGGLVPVRDVSLERVAVYQAVEVDLAIDGRAVTDRNAPVVAGRPALVRAFLRPEAGYAARELTGRLELIAPGAAPVVLTDRRRITAASRPEDLSTTLRFEVPGEALTPGVRFKLGVFEPGACGASGSGGAVYPASGDAELGVRSIGGTFRVVLVPFRYDADGSGRMPELTPAQIQLMRDTMYRMFPVPDVELTVRDPVAWDRTITRSGTGWGTVLDALLAVRQQDRPPGDTYYYGIFAPASSFRAYCSGGCITGLGPVPAATDRYARGSVGIGYAGEATAETFVHEIGHALGRSHAPCGTQGYAGYPYSNGGIGVWGYDLLGGSLVPPSRYKDIMSYCDPQWVSDHHFERWFARLEAIRSQAQLLPDAPAGAWTSLVVEDGAAIWGATLDFVDGPPGGTPETVELVAADGSVTEVEGRALALDHGGRIVRIPTPTGPVQAVRLAGAAGGPRP